MVRKKEWFEETDEKQVKTIKEKFKMQKGIGLLVFVVIVILFCLAIGPLIIETVEAGKYQICQNIITGNLAPQMKPGPYLRLFGHVSEYPVADTFYFTKDEEGGKGDWSIHVQFMDGSTCDISGTCRVEYPKTEKEALALLSDHGFRNADDVEERLILPVVRRSLMMSANFITAKESYSDKRAEFISEAWDQIDNGVYVTREQEIKENDIITGQPVTRIRKVKVIDPTTGKVMREKNPLEGLGLSLKNFEIKKFEYSEAVTNQIKAQQEALMGVQTAKANAQKSEQEAISAEAMGKANVMKSKYEKEQEKIKAVVEAEQQKEVAETLAAKEKAVALIEATKKLEVADKDRQTAEIHLKIADLEKQAKVLEAEGESTYKQKVFMADGGLLPKLEALTQINKVWSEAYAQRKVPSVEMSGNSSGSGTDTNTLAFMNVLAIKAMKDLALDMNIKSNVPMTQAAIETVK